MCKKKVETAQDRGRSFASIATMGMSQKKYLPGQVVHFCFLSFFLSLNTNFDFFSLLRRAEVETGGLPVLYLRVDCSKRSCEHWGVGGEWYILYVQLEFANSDWCDRLHMHRLWRVDLRFNISPIR